MSDTPDQPIDDAAARNELLYELFCAALDLPESQRDVFLHRACGDDHGLRADVLAMLLEHLAGSSAASAAATPPEQGEGKGGPPAGRPMGPAGPIGPGTVIGNYTLVKLVGAGTFGTVYEARQKRPIRRTVAVKILNPGMQSPEVLRRFRVEFQSLALLSHPNIASVYDADEAQPGVPYFVMEFVPGASLTRYCRDHNLDLRARLSLFCQVCDAVHYAHIQGVIHRDLKPGNILVVPPPAGSPASAAPTLKIVDFGLARSTQAEGQVTAAPTEVGAILGTLAYMAPEQALGSPSEVDKRADIYSLGVIAYELLAGQLPFDVQNGAILDALKRIQSEEPSRLSSINRALRGDIETIVGKAMAKEKPRRYASAAELSADIGRYLRDEPIMARPASTWYQLSKFSRRNRPLVGGIAAAILVLVAGLIATTWQMTRARRAETKEAAARKVADQQRTEAEFQRAEAQRQAQEAKRETDIAQAVSDFQTEMLSAADPRHSFGDKVTVLQAVQAATERLDSGSLKGQPLVEAAVRDAIGTTLFMLGRFGEAETALRASLEIRRKISPAGHADIAVGLSHLALVLQAENKGSEAETFHREALAIFRAVRPAGDPDIATSLTYLAGLLREQNRLREAEPLFCEALAIYRSARPAGHPDIAVAMNNLALLLHLQGRLAEAEPLYREALGILRKVPEVQRQDLATSLGNFALFLQAENKPAEAEPFYREALDICRVALPAGHPDLARALNNLAVFLQSQNRLTEAEPLFRKALTIYRGAAPADDLKIANAESGLGRSLLGQGKTAEAEPLLREALAVRSKMLGDAAVPTAATASALTELLVRTGRGDEARELGIKYHFPPATNPTTRPATTAGGAGH